MIWYRHWLEVRTRASLLVTAALVAGPLYLGSEIFDPRPAAWPPMIMGPLQALASSLDAQQIVAVARHAEFTWFAILMTWLIAGDGLRVSDESTGGAAPGVTHYTLSLPVSRRRIVLTRVAVGYTTAAIVLAVSLAANAMMLVALDRAVPIVPMLVASAFATLVVLFWICLINILIALTGFGWGGALTLFLMLVTTPIPMWGMTSAAAGTLQWPLLMLFGIVLSIAIYLSMELSSGDEW